MKGLLVIGVVLLAEAALAATAPTLAVALSIDDGPACNGKYKGGLKPTNLELADIFKQHAAWMNDAGVADPEMANDPRRANLCGANLEGVQLKHADLKGANLTGADLEGADLVGAQLTFSDLESADLMYTHLEGAELYGANLKSAILISTHLEGADLSPRLIAEYQGPANCQVADCRSLPFTDRSKDVLIVQGGLHHLPTLPQDLERTFAEMQRVLKPTGRVLFVEPWLTLFLKFVHGVSQNPLARRVSPKLDALATMIHYERVTYEQWLSQPQVITRLARAHFSPVHESFAWGKWNFVGTPR